MKTPWLGHVRRLQAIAQTGLAYTKDPYDRQRYRELEEVTSRLIGDLGDLDPEEVRQVFTTEGGYATPKVDVRAAVFRDDAILLVRERSDGCWTLPGGWADIGEPPSEVLAKEVREESGYEVHATKLIAVYDRDSHGHPPIAHHVYKLFFLCEITGGSPETSVETSAVGFFHEDEIPELSTSRVLPAQIIRMFDHYRNPDIPTEFD